MNDAISELAGRVEALAGPDRGVDWTIHLRNGLDGVGMYGAHPAYTGSLDAAMSLVPEGFCWQVNFDPRRCHASVIWDDGFGQIYTIADSPALALTAACLRAKAKQ